ncbi:hypothetical protein KAR91_24770 [Candidatus Pacearchaeota archaeon]|nr:hypothetical protein [Candidatus Pacearchaeota archaeon]
MSLERIENKIDKIDESLNRVEINVDRNTRDVEVHIKRTNIIESKLQKMIYLLMIGAGIGIALYGPQFIKILGLFI